MTNKRILELAQQCPHDIDIVDVVQFARAIETEVLIESRPDDKGLSPMRRFVVERERYALDEQPRLDDDQN